MNKSFWNAAHWSVDAVSDDALRADSYSIEAQYDALPTSGPLVDGAGVIEHDIGVDGAYEAHANDLAGAQGR